MKSKECVPLLSSELSTPPSARGSNRRSQVIMTNRLAPALVWIVTGMVGPSALALATAVAWGMDVWANNADTNANSESESERNSENTRPVHSLAIQPSNAQHGPLAVRTIPCSSKHNAGTLYLASTSTSPKANASAPSWIFMFLDTATVMEEAQARSSSAIAKLNSFFNMRVLDSSSLLDSELAFQNQCVCRRIRVASLAAAAVTAAGSSSSTSLLPFILEV